MLSQPKGVTIPTIMEATGWQQHSVRGLWNYSSVSGARLPKTGVLAAIAGDISEFLAQELGNPPSGDVELLSEAPTGGHFSRFGKIFSEWQTDWLEQMDSGFELAHSGFEPPLRLPICKFGHVLGA